MSIAIYPGSFDPVTLGHLNIIKRAAACFDKLIVCVMVNSKKQGMFTPEERVDLLRRSTERFHNVEVDFSDGGVGFRAGGPDGGHQPETEPPAGNHVPGFQ